MTNSEKIFKPSALEREVATRMCARLDVVTLKPKVILVEKNQAGSCEELLKQRYPEAQILATENFSSIQNESVDLVFSPLSNGLTAESSYEWRRILRPEGLLMFSCFGPDTLKELHGKLPQIPSPHWIDMHDVGDALTRTGWLDPVMDVEYIEVNYRDKEKLIQDLQRFTHIANNLTEERFSLTYEVIYGHAWSPGIASGFSSDDEGVARIPLSHLRRRR